MAPLPRSARPRWYWYWRGNDGFGRDPRSTARRRSRAPMASRRQRRRRRRRREPPSRLRQQHHCGRWALATASRPRASSVGLESSLLAICPCATSRAQDLQGVSTSRTGFSTLEICTSNHRFGRKKDRERRLQARRGRPESWTREAKTS